MNKIDITNHLTMKKLNLEEEKDQYLINQLEKDDLVCGDYGYLWSKSYYPHNPSYLQQDDIYNSPFSLYYDEIPIGYFEVSSIYEMPEKSSVCLAYALLEEARGYGFMQKILTSVSNDILLDRVQQITEVALLIDSKNIASQKVAIKSGFSCERLPEDTNYQSLTYLKKRITPSIYSTSNSSKIIS